MDRAHISAAEFRALPQRAAKPLKYRNKPVVTEEGRFASQKEHARWRELKLLERAGEISRLERQVAIPIIVSGRRVADYVCDASYLDRDGKQVVEDTKSAITRKDPLYRLKKRLVSAVHNIEIKEV